MSQTLLILGIWILTTVSAHLCLKKGVLSFGALEFSIQNLLNLIPRILKNFWLIGGIILLGISFLIWLVVLSRIKLSLAYPIATGLNFTLIVLFSWLLFREQLLPIQIFGIAIILFGIFILLKSLN